MCLIASYCTVCKQHESISRVQPSSVPAILQSSGESYFIATESNVADMRYLLHSDDDGFYEGCLEGS